MRVIDEGPKGRVSLERLGGVLVAVLLAFVLSVLLAALIASQVPGNYSARAYAYLGLVAWILVGSVLLFRTTVQAASGPFTVGRLAVWIISIWLWPLLLVRRRPSREP
jgi:hypothetical protein